MFSMSQHRVHYTSEAIVTLVSLLMVLRLNTHRYDNQSADLVVSAVMPRNFLPSTLTTGLYSDVHNTNGCTLCDRVIL